MIMRKLYLLAAAVILLLAGCAEKVSDPVFKEGEFYIYSDTWAEKIIVKLGEPIRRDIRVSPADGTVKCSWSLDSKLISNWNEMTWTFNSLGTYTLVFTAEKDGVVKSRTATVVVEPVS